MVELGKYNLLTINRFVDFGAYLEGDDLGEILIPKKYLPEGVQEDDEVDVFVHLDGEERYVATTENVLAQVGECALMEVVAVSDHGAFMDWGLVKNLFVPFREQKEKFRVGEFHLIFVYVDEVTFRIVGTTRLMKYLPNNIEAFREEEQVRIIIWRETPSGFLAIIENECIGMIFRNQIFSDIKPGDKMFAFIKKIREDSKIDLVLQEQGYGKVEDFSFDLEEYLLEHKSLNLHDKSDPNDIRDKFGVSKKIFKKAIGKLYKEGIIEITPDGIKLKIKNIV